MNVLASLEFLVGAFKSKYWWFELYELFRKLMLTGVFSLIFPASDMQMVLGILMCLHSFWVYIELKPFRTTSDNELAIGALFGTFLVLFAAQLIKLRSLYITSPEGDKNIGILIVIMIFAFPIWGVLLIIYDIYGPASRFVQHGVTSNLAEMNENSKKGQVSVRLLKKGEREWDFDDDAYPMWILEDPTEHIPEDEKIKLRIKATHVSIELPFRRGNVGGDQVMIKWPFGKIEEYDGEIEGEGADLMQLFHIRIGNAKFTFETEFVDPIITELDHALESAVSAGRTRLFTACTKGRAKPVSFCFGSVIAKIQRNRKDGDDEDGTENDDTDAFALAALASLSGKGNPNKATI
jgi:hypothetical protein